MYHLDLLHNIVVNKIYLFGNGVVHTIAQGNVVSSQVNPSGEGDWDAMLCGVGDHAILWVGIGTLLKITRK